jgi:hypothetical protein
MNLNEYAEKQNPSETQEDDLLTEINEDLRTVDDEIPEDENETDSTAEKSPADTAAEKKRFTRLNKLSAKSITKGVDIAFANIARKQRGSDVVVAAHALTLEPRMFFSFASHFVMFKTQDNIVGRKDVINPEWYENLSEMQRRINQHPDLHYYEIFTTQKAQ